VSSSSMADITRYGGPILYLFCCGLFLFTILVIADSGTFLPRKLTALRRRAKSRESKDHQEVTRDDVIKEAKSVSTSDDLLRALQVTKSYGANKVVDDISLGVPRDTVFAMLGPNGAGKTTLFKVMGLSFPAMS
jgi:ATP-binding cassette subfamily A (ABC1) protein 3